MIESVKIGRPKFLWTIQKVSSHINILYELKSDHNEVARYLKCDTKVGYYIVKI